MEFRQLGRSGLKVPALSFGTGTFGGGTEFFRAWGASDVAEATRLVSICMEAGVNLFDTADVYSAGPPRRFLARQSPGVARMCCSRPRPHSAWARDRTIWDRRGII